MKFFLLSLARSVFLSVMRESFLSGQRRVLFVSRGSFWSVVGGEGGGEGRRGEEGRGGCREGAGGGSVVGVGSI